MGAPYPPPVAAIPGGNAPANQVCGCNWDWPWSSGALGARRLQLWRRTDTDLLGPHVDDHHGGGRRTDHHRPGAALGPLTLGAPIALRSRPTG